MGVQLIKEHGCHGGRVAFYRHPSDAVGGEMRFGVYTPPQLKHGVRLPALTYLAGLTCTEETFLIKGGAPAFAARHGIILIAPDTSPRGAGVAGEDDGWDFGTGAGFYIDATRAPWSANYRMETYVTEELQRLVTAELGVDRDRQGIFGHSMGGHGALTLGFKRPDIYKSISAFAPISAPTRCPWGEKAFTGYLGENRAEWARHDAVEIIRNGNTGPARPLLVDQGLSDEFLGVQLNPHLLAEACEAAGYPLTLRQHQGYDHGYFFISTFMGDHIAHHAAALCGT